MNRLLMLALVLAGGCSYSQRASEPVDLMWVAAQYSGGVQCQANIGYHPPNTIDVLRRQRVTVHATAREELPVCQACDCPGYSAMHYALITKRDLRRAARVNYHPRTPPDYAMPDSLRPDRR